MKGIVAEIKGKYAVVLTQDGLFKRVRALPGMTVGMETDCGQQSGDVRGRRLAVRAASMAAVGLLALGVGFGAYSYTIPYSYVDIDINPSIELTVNVYDRIIGAEALNDDGRKLLTDKELRHKKLDNGVTEILNSALEYGYLKAATEFEDSTETPGMDGLQTGNSWQASGDDSQAAGSSVQESGNTLPSGGGKDQQETTAPDGNGAGTKGDAGQSGKGPEIENAVMVTVSSNNSKKSVELKKKIAATASKELDKDKVNSEILVGEASNEQRAEAKKLGVTPGKLALIEDALKHLPDKELKDVKNTAVKELIEIARENIKAVPAKKGTPGNEKGKTESSSDKANSGNKTGRTENSSNMDSDGKNISDKTGNGDNPVSSRNNKDEKGNMKNSPLGKNITGAGEVKEDNIKKDSTKGTGDLYNKSGSSSKDSNKDSNKGADIGINKNNNSINNSSNNNNKNNSIKSGNDKKENQSHKKNDNNDKKESEKSDDKLIKEREKLKDEFLRQIEKNQYEANKGRTGQDNDKNKSEDKDSKKNNDKKKVPAIRENNGTGNGAKGKDGSRK